MNTAQQSRLSIVQLRAELAGRVLGPGDPGYDGARASSCRRSTGALQRSSGPSTRGEVALVVSLARETGLELAIRGGGHSDAGYGTSEGGIVLDLAGPRPARRSTPRGRVARAAGGLTSGDVTVAAARARPRRRLRRHVLGRDRRAHARRRGRLPRAQARSDDRPSARRRGRDRRRPGARGRRREPSRPLLGDPGRRRQLRRRHPLRLPAAPGRHGHRRDARAARDARDDCRARGGGGGGAGGAVDDRQRPPGAAAAVLPPELVGEPAPARAMLVHAGPLDEGERAVAPLRALAPPVADFVRPMPFARCSRRRRPEPPPRAVVRTFFSDSLDEAAASELLDRLRASTAQLPAARDPGARRRDGPRPGGRDRVRAPAAATCW